MALTGKTNSDIPNALMRSEELLKKWQLEPTLRSRATMVVNQEYNTIVNMGSDHLC